MPIGYSLGDAKPMSTINAYHPTEFTLLNRKLSPIEMMSVITSAKCYIGASLHGCITAFSYGTPEIACNYTNFNKVSGFFELIGHEEYLVNRPNEIYDVFKKGLTRDFSNLPRLKDEINQHFLHISETIIKPPKDKQISDIADEIMDYINQCNDVLTSPEMHIEKFPVLSKQLTASSQHIENLEAQQKNDAMLIQKLNEDCNKMQAEIESIMDSKVWKLTKPLRRLLDAIKK